uniref:RING-type domain-containing protein n=1 Tax=Amphimedon queenslandica TaxID=400682 RepID=A0A1X7STK2_AMPQE
MATKLDDNLDDPLYIYPVPKGLVTNCPVCFVSLYQNPFVNGECGHHLCGSCSKRLKFCPECRVSLKTHPDKSLQRVLKSLSVYCNKKNEGCEWEGELGDLQHHQENCVRAVIRCATCDLEGPRDFISIHQSEECIFRIVSCKYCHHHYSWSDLNSHYDLCSEYVIQCSECYASITRGYEKTHKNEVCPLAYVKCVASQYGCQWEGYRRAMDDHVKNNLAVHFHLCLQQGSKNEEALASCKDVIKQLESEVKKKNQEITSLHQKLESEVKKRNQEITLLRQKVSTLEQNNQCLLKTQIPSMENEMRRKMAIWQDAAENDLRKELTEYIDECLESGEETDNEDDEDDDYDSDSDIVKQKPTFFYELYHFVKSKNKDKDVLSPSFYANGYHMRLREILIVQSRGLSEEKLLLNYCTMTMDDRIEES